MPLYLMVGKAMKGSMIGLVFSGWKVYAFPDKPYPLARTMYLWMSQKTVRHETKQMSVFCYCVPIRCYRWCCMLIQGIVK